MNFEYRCTVFVFLRADIMTFCVMYAGVISMPLAGTLCIRISLLVCLSVSGITHMVDGELS